MKHLTIIAVSLVWLLLPNLGYTMDLELSVAPTYTHYVGDMETGASSKVILGTDNYYLWLTGEDGKMRKLPHISYGSLQLIGVGPGVKKDLWGRIVVFLEMGYFFKPSADIEGTWYHSDYVQDSSGNYWEALAEPMAIELKPLEIPLGFGLGGTNRHHWPAYTYEIKGGCIGGSVGASVNALTRGDLALDFFGSYRFAKITEKVTGFNPDYPPEEENPHWITNNARDLSAVVVGLEITYRF